MKKLILFTILGCSLILNTAKSSYADSAPVPNNYVQVVTAAQNTNGVRQLIDCSKPGAHTLSVIVYAGASATVVVNAIGANQDGTPNMGASIIAYTLLSSASGASPPLTVPVGAFSFYQINMANTGVALTLIAGCR